MGLGSGQDRVGIKTGTWVVNKTGLELGEGEGRDQDWD